MCTRAINYTWKLNNLDRLERSSKGEKKKRIDSEQKTIEHLEKDLIEKKSVEKKKRQVAEILLQEANEKLKKAIDAIQYHYGPIH